MSSITAKERATPRGQLPTRWSWLIDWFRWYSKNYLRKNFHAVRLSRSGLMPALGDEPVVIYLNHPSWWDPLICVLLSTMLRDRAHFAPMDAASFKQYRFFRRLGFFPVERDSISGAKTFIQTSLAIVEQPKPALWITAQGHFTDPRVRPVRLYPGIGHLLARSESASALPLAIEYPFWTEKTPEAVLRFGEPIPHRDHPHLTAKQWTELLRDTLEDNQDQLAAEACERNPEAFETLLSGRTGVGGVFDFWRRAKALLRGQRFDPSHSDNDTRG